MVHSHDHDHPHAHGDHVHTHDTDVSPEVAAAVDLSVPDAALSPRELSRRSLLRRGGVLGGAAVMAGSVLGAPSPALAAKQERGGHTPPSGLYWLTGDHHIHTKYSSDAQYRVIDHARHANAYGLDWMVITDHGSIQHAKIGVEKVNPEIKAARTEIPETLIFQGFEWNIPGAEHGTVFVHPGSNEVAVLKEFENSFDGVVNNWTASTSDNEAHALDGLDFLAASVGTNRVKDALFLANHPARKGLDSPHEIRNWRDRQPTVAIGMEGAPGHQAAGIAAPFGPGSGRGFYDNSPTADSFAAYPPESYRTWGGFDWMTSTVGGLWDSLLAEGKPWFVTSNSDSHMVYLDDSVRDPASDFTNNGFYDGPIHGTAGPAFVNGDFWPGYYSRTHVGAKHRAYADVMKAMRAGRVWVDHGALLKGLDVRARVAGTGQVGAPLGGVLHIRRGAQVELLIGIDFATDPNWAQFVPKLARVDVIQGNVTGAAADLDSFNTPDTKVVKSYDVSELDGSVVLKFQLGAVHGPIYLRVRGTDGNRSAVGINGAAIDPAGPAMDVLGDADPWGDLWFYANPIWILPRA